MKGKGIPDILHPATVSYIEGKVQIDRGVPSEVFNRNQKR